MSRAESILLTVWVFLLLIISTATLVDASSEKSGDQSEEKRELLGVLQKVLEKLQNRRTVTWERKHSRLPGCNIGDFCTVKKGSRFGQLCDCPRGSKCNLFFLKCL
ncbi:cocaine- and amphetamine-regulated transcript protein-like [Salminus brasiliensis]|uniref:cocaine- and amphetamine-regulated transcript protein-like n=1 Tax=Salminus brasiliensis TaxID=930266 RepID=UPI003B83785F